MNKQLGQAFMSSSNPEELGMMVKGLLMGAVPMLLFGFRAFGVEGLNESILTNSVDSVAAATQAVTAAVASVMVAFGFLRKIFNAIKKTFVNK